MLDEADRMLDDGFENDIRKIIGCTSQKNRQTVMCEYYFMNQCLFVYITLAVSATWPESVRRLASSFQNKPVRVTVGSDQLSANGRVEQRELASFFLLSGH